jgi:hypothetical protein
MGNSGSTSSDQGEKFLVKILFVRHRADEEVDKDSDAPEIPAGLYFHEYLLVDRTHIFEMTFTEYRKIPKEGCSIFRRLFAVKERIDFVTVYNSYPLSLQQPSDAPIHEFVVFNTMSWFRISKNM